MCKIKLLVVEENKNLGSLIIASARTKQECKVDYVTSYTIAKNYIEDNQYNIIALGIDNDISRCIEQIKIIKECYGGPILFLLSDECQLSLVCDFKMGIDDYIVKPFNVDEFYLRVKRSCIYSSNYNVIQIDCYNINEFENTVTVKGIPIKLSYIAMQILILLLKENGKILSREKIFERLWGYDYTYSSRVIDTHVSYIRKEIKDTRLKSVRGVGYIFKL